MKLTHSLSINAEALEKAMYLLGVVMAPFGIPDNHGLARRIDLNRKFEVSVKYDPES